MFVDEATAVKTHRGLAVAQANRYWRNSRPAAERRGLDREDLESIALVGLIQAIRAWDPSRGSFSTLAHPVVVKECDEELPDNNASPYLRGLAVDSGGTVYAAATGCHGVVKISPDGKVETVLKAERPWTPTGVALFGGDVYVLEYANHNSGNAPGREWQPRVRKLGRDGKVSTLAIIPLQRRASGP